MALAPIRGARVLVLELEYSLRLCFCFRCWDSQPATLLAAGSRLDLDIDSATIAKYRSIPYTNVQCPMSNVILEHYQYDQNAQSVVSREVN